MIDPGFRDLGLILYTQQEKLLFSEFLKQNKEIIKQLGYRVNENQPSFYFKSKAPKMYYD